MANTKSESKLGKARLMKETALAKMRVLQAAALERTLIPVEQVRSTWAYAFASLRDRALSMGDRIASRGAGRDAAELRVIVETEVREMLEAVSRGEF